MTFFITNDDLAVLDHWRIANACCIHPSEFLATAQNILNSLHESGEISFGHGEMLFGIGNKVIQSMRINSTFFNLSF